MNLLIFHKTELVYLLDSLLQKQLLDLQVRSYVCTKLVKLSDQFGKESVLLQIICNLYCVGKKEFLLKKIGWFHEKSTIVNRRN